jgi:2'-5' RNA ligase
MPQPAGDVARPRAPSGVRLFFALWPDDVVREALTHWAERLHQACGGRMTRPQNLHVTLAFLGDTEAERLDELKAAVARVTPRAFELVLDEPGYWKHNRIAWAGATKDPDALLTMVADLRAALLGARFRFDPKPFVSHVTLVRKGNSPPEVPRLAPIVWRVPGFALIRSVPGPSGSDYAVEAEWRAA